jgi:type IV pilus assembly protein PilB
MKFGEFLIKESIVSEEVIQDALASQKFVRVPLGRLLKNLGLFSESDLDDALTKFFSMMVERDVNSLLNQIADDENLTEQRDWAKTKGVLLLDRSLNTLKILTTHFRDDLVQEAEEKFEDRINFVRTTADILDHCFTIVFGEDEKDHSKIRVVRRKSDDQKISEVDPFTSVFRDCIVEARKRDASDIHIEPVADGVQIRFRIMGDLKLWRKLDLEHKDGFIRAVKQLSNLSIATSGRPQDARISFESWKLDIRVNCMPVLYGEKICLRLLDLSRSFELENFGFCEKTTAALRGAISHDNGVVIVSGPTGSGKTSTLYSLINELDRKKKNIATVEHPVEFTFGGVNQTNITEKISLKDALRALLRQDPDVILVGEIRDEETAEICFQAGATGHLVLSSIHTNGAAENVGRLRDLGVDEATIRDNLLFAFSQKLRKKLCPKCSEEVEQGYRRANNLGCESCEDGFASRVPVAEYIERKGISSIFETGSTTYGMSFAESLNGRALAGEIEFSEGIKSLNSNK